MDCIRRLNDPDNDERSRVEQRANSELPIQNTSRRIQSARGTIPLYVPVDQYCLVNTPCQQYLIIEPLLSVSSRDLKRKRSCVEDGILPTTTSVDFSAFPFACHSLLSKTFTNMPDFPQEGPWVSWDAGMEDWGEKVSDNMQVSYRTESAWNQ